MVMGVLDHGDGETLPHQQRDRPRQQGGLAGTAPAREAYHFHVDFVSGTHRVVIARSNATKQSRPVSAGRCLDCFAALAMTGAAALHSPLAMLISAWTGCHASLHHMMKIEKAPVPLIVPNPDDPRLTERVVGIDQTGAKTEIKV